MTPLILFEVIRENSRFFIIFGSFQFILRCRYENFMVLQHPHIDAIFNFFSYSSTLFQRSAQGEFLGRLSFTTPSISSNSPISKFLKASAKLQRACISLSNLQVTTLSCSMGLNQLSSNRARSPASKTISKLILRSSLFLGLKEPYLEFSMQQEHRKLAHSAKFYCEQKVGAIYYFIFDRYAQFMFVSCSYWAIFMYTYFSFQLQSCFCSFRYMIYRQLIQNYEAKLRLSILGISDLAFQQSSLDFSLFWSSISFSNIKKQHLSWECKSSNPPIRANISSQKDSQTPLSTELRVLIILLTDCQLVLSTQFISRIECRVFLASVPLPRCTCISRIWCRALAFQLFMLCSFALSQMSEKVLRAYSYFFQRSSYSA